MFSINRNQKGFTLIELVIIIVILGILAAVAIPRYQDMSAQAKESAARGSLGNLRSAITIYYANQAVTTGIATWPTLAELTTFNTVLATTVPRNPFQLTTNAPDSVVTGVTPGTIVGARGGWAYLATTGQIWLNTNTVGENLW